MLLCPIVPPHTVSMIQSVYPSKIDAGLDQLVWKDTFSGVFSVSNVLFNFNAAFLE